MTRQRASGIRLLAALAISTALAGCAAGGTDHLVVTEKSTITGMSVQPSTALIGAFGF